MPAGPSRRMVIVIPQIGLSSNRQIPEAELLEWLPRLCPRCGTLAVVGHGRRHRSAHDEHHTFIRVRRGLCQHCELTITVLPAWCLPYTHYSLAARADFLHHHVEEGSPLEQAAPATQDPDRVADPATLRRWLQRRAASWLAGVLTLQEWGRVAANLLAPTILAWDWPAAARILFPEPKPT
jgi:hypothetical protein